MLSNRQTHSNLPNSRDPMLSSEYLYRDVKAVIVRNQLENTKYVYVSQIPEDYSEDDRQKVYAALHQRLNNKDGKYYIQSIQIAREYMDYLNQNILVANIQKTYIDDLVERTRSKLVDLEQNPKLPLKKKYKLNALATIDHENIFDLSQCVAISEFQQKRLSVMRPDLSEEQSREKNIGRYGVDAIKTKCQTENILIYSATNSAANDKIVATLVVNRHVAKEFSEANAYVSDLLVDDQHIADQEFINAFFSNVFADLKSKCPHLTSLVLMAPGDPRAPLIKCIEAAQQAGFCQPLTPEAQIKFGVVPFFIMGAKKDEQLKMHNPQLMFAKTAKIDQEVKTESAVYRKTFR